MKWIAILRGINVGGRRKLLMADLKVMLADLGYTDVVTYIQSGNVVFNAIDKTREGIEKELESEIEKRFSLDVPVIVRTQDELQKIVIDNPYAEQYDISQLCLSFLKDHPDKQLSEALEENNKSEDLFKISDKDIYIVFQGNVRESKLSNNFFEKKLKTTATTRNWKTVNKLIDLANK